MMVLNKKVWRPLVIGVLLLGGGALLYRHFHIQEFSAVDPGRLYRSGQPENFDWTRLMCKYHFRTVIDLRPGKDRKNGFWFSEEQRAAEHFGFNLVLIPMPEPVPTAEQADRFLDCLGQPTNQPVLVHCRNGLGRTGIMTAVYRMHVQGWTLEQAVAELNMDQSRPTVAKAIRFLRDYHPGDSRSKLARLPHGTVEGER